MRPYILTDVDKEDLRRLRIAQDDDRTPALERRPSPSSTDDTHGDRQQ